MSITARPSPSLPGRGAVAPAPAALRDLPALTWVPVAALLSVGLLAVLAPSTAADLAWPIAAAGVVLGIPHGAVDHLVPWWWAARTAPVRALWAFALGYAAVAAAALAAFLLAPTPTVAVFLVLSAVHFGRGEVASWAERAGRPVPPPGADLLPAAATGATVVGALLWADPATTDPLLRAVTPALADVVLAVRGPAGAAVVLLVLLAGARLLAAGRRGDAAEVLLVAAVFAVSPPLAAFGVWFGAWHALRHTGRLLDLARAAVERAGGPSGWATAWARLVRAAWVPSAAAFAAIGMLWALRDVASLEAQVSILLALTFPHAAVVWTLDRRRA